MSDTEERLEYPEAEPGETADGYRRRVAALGGAYAAGAKQARDQESGDRRYASDMSYKGTKYSSDAGLKGTKYSSDQSLAGTKYSADQSLAGTKYRADVDERGNRMNAGNQYLSTYANLLEKPSNYFAAQNFLANGQAAGYTPFVQEAVGTVMPGRTFRPYVGTMPGNAAQALFHQGGDDKMTQEGGDGFHPPRPLRIVHPFDSEAEDEYTSADGTRWFRDPYSKRWIQIIDTSPPMSPYDQGGDNQMAEVGGDNDSTARPGEIRTADDGSRWRFEVDGTWSMVSPPTMHGASISGGEAPYGGGRIINLPPAGSPPYVSMPEGNRGTTTRYPNDGVTIRQGYDQGGESGRTAQRKAERRRYIGGYNDRFKQAYGVDDIGKRALKDWQRESGRDAPDWSDATDRANFDRYVEDWRGVHVPTMQSSSAMKPKPDPVFRPYVDPAEAEARRQRAEAERHRPSFTDRLGRFGIPGSFITGPYNDDNDIVWDGNGDGGGWDRHGGYAQGGGYARRMPYAQDGTPVSMPTDHTDPEQDAWDRRNRDLILDANERRPIPDRLVIENSDWQPWLADEPTGETQRGPLILYPYISPRSGAHRQIDQGGGYARRMPYAQDGTRMEEDGGDSTVDPTPYKGFGPNWWRKVKNPETGVIEVEELEIRDPRLHQGFGQRWYQPVRNTRTGAYEDLELPDPDPTPYQGFGQRWWRKIRNPSTGEIESVDVTDEVIPGNRTDPIRRYEQGGESANWMTDDSWATPEDKQRLAEMDRTFKPGVHRWKPGYWAGLDDTSKGLWRSYWGYRGLSPDAVEHQIEGTRIGNQDAFGMGRTI